METTPEKARQERNLTKQPKLGFLGWGFAGGFISSQMPGSGRGTLGMALLIVGAWRVFGEMQKAADPAIQGRLFLLAVACFIAAVVSLGSGYSAYTKAYDEELKALGPMVPSEGQKPGGAAPP